MTQHDLFGDAAPARPVWQADPEKVRRRLERILSEIREAQVMPWEPAQLDLFRTIVPNMADRLPPEEAARWRAEFFAQLARFDAVRGVAHFPRAWPGGQWRPTVLPPSSPFASLGTPLPP